MRASCFQRQHLYLLFSSIITLLSSVDASNLPHPAGWHTETDIIRVRSLIASGKEPWHTAYKVLMNDTSLPPDFQPSPASIVCRTCCNVACCPPGKACGATGSGGLEKASYLKRTALLYPWIPTCCATPQHKLCSLPSKDPPELFVMTVNLGWPFHAA